MSTTHFSVNQNAQDFNIYSVLDNVQTGDCVSLSTLDKFCLDLVGVPLADTSVRFVYPRSSSWTGLSSILGNANEMRGNTPLLFWSGSPALGSSNAFEGCLYFNPGGGQPAQWWLGGMGIAPQKSAWNVLMLVTQPNRVTSSHQFFQNSLNIAVPYPYVRNAWVGKTQAQFTALLATAGYTNVKIQTKVLAANDPLIGTVLSFNDQQGWPTDPTDKNQQKTWANPEDTIVITIGAPPQ